METLIIQSSINFLMHPTGCLFGVHQTEKLIISPEINLEIHPTEEVQKSSGNRHLMKAYSINW